MPVDIVAILKQYKAVILERWIENQLTSEGLRDDLISNEEIRSQSQELVEALLDCFESENSTDAAAMETVEEVLSGISITRARQGFSPRETGQFVFGLKNALISTLNDQVQDDPAALYAATLKINALMDDLAITSFETFIKGREEVILRQTDEISEISTPVIQVWNGILALPIIGTLDSSRTQIVMENLLQEIVNTGSEIAILDISGVPAVDSLVAQHLLKTVAATRLMGAECIISGIRPEIAQTIVHLGIDLSGIVTKATLASALAAAFVTLKLQVRKIPTIKKFAEL